MNRMSIHCSEQIHELNLFFFKKTLLNKTKKMKNLNKFKDQKHQIKL